MRRQGEKVGPGHSWKWGPDAVRKLSLQKLPYGLAPVFMATLPGSCASPLFIGGSVSSERSSDLTKATEIINGERRTPELIICKGVGVDGWKR